MGLIFPVTWYSTVTLISSVSSIACGNSIKNALSVLIDWYVFVIVFKFTSSSSPLLMV
ncbi:MAG: hypothetical protein V8R91_19230 [Butyricimonas faecihominis]